METAFFHIGPIGVYGFGLALGLGFLSAGAVGRSLAQQRGVAPSSWWWTVVGVMFVSTIGARIVYVLPDIRFYWSHPTELWRPPVEGFSFYGGVLFGGVFLAWAARRVSLSFWELADLLALSYLTGFIVTGVVWGTSAAAAGIPEWLVFVIDALYVSGAYALLWWAWLRHRESTFAGEVALLVFAGDGLLRLVLGSLSALFAPGGWVALWPDHVARFAVTLLAAILFLHRGAGSRLLVPIVRPFHRPLSRWVGWFVVYGFLLALMVAAHG